MIEMKTLLAMLLPQVSFQLAVPSEEITTDCQLTIGMGRGLPCFVKRCSARDRVCSNLSSSSLRERASEGSEVAPGDTTGASASEAEYDESASQFGSCSESGYESTSGQSTTSSRQRAKKRKSGWSRQRRSRFWQSVRASTPERWPVA